MDSVGTAFIRTTQIMKSRLFLKEVKYIAADPFSSAVFFILPAEMNCPDHILIQEDSALICLGLPKKKYMKPPLQLLVLDDDISLAELSNEVNRIFFEFETLEQKLQEAVNNGRSIQYMVDLIAPYFNGNELQVATVNYTLLGLSNKTVHLYEMSGFDQPGIGGLLPGDILTFFKNDINFSQIRDLKEPFIYGPSIFTCRLLCMNVFHHGEYVSRVIICEDRNPFRGYEASLIRFFTAFIQLVFDLSADGSEILPRSQLTDVLLNLLSGKYVDQGMLEQTLSQWKWNLAGPFLCAVLMLSDRDFYNRTIQYYCQLFNREYPGCCFLEYDQAIVCVADLGYYDGSEERFAENHLKAFRDNNFRVGYSNIFSDITMLQRYNIQAKIALRIGQQRAAFKWFYKFSDIVLYYMKSKITEELNEAFLCSPEILILYKHDNENQSEYLRTLKVYIDNNMNAVKAAGELYIHRATMIYRLERIKKLTGLDFKNLHKLLYLTISINLLLEK